MKDSISRMAKLFKSLTKRQKSNLKYHLDNKTPILCGDKAMKFVSDGVG